MIMTKKITDEPVPGTKVAKGHQMMPFLVRIASNVIGN